MKIRYLPQYAIALAIVVVGLAFAGVSVGTLLPALLVLVCPLMMLLMMSGMHGKAEGSHRHDDDDPRDHSGEHDRDGRPRSGRL